MSYFKSKLTVVVILLATCLFNVYGQKTETSWNGDWKGQNQQGDINVTLTINVNKKSNLNPHNTNSLCNGFITVYIIEPNQRQSVLSTYELSLEKNDVNKLLFSYIGGREGVDSGEGKCEASINNGKLQLKVLQSNGEDVLFDQVEYTNAAIKLNNKESNNIGDTILSILIVLVYVGIIAHMIYVYFKGSRYKEIYTLDGMTAKRTEENKPSEMTEEEYNQCVNLLEDAFAVWTIQSQTENGEEIRKPTKMKQIKASSLLIDQAIALRPTDQEVIDRINELTDVINSNEKRYFDGSKALVWLGIIVGILLGFVMGPGVSILTLISTGCYILASRTPAFLVEKRANRGGGNIHNGMIAGIFGMIAGAQTIRTITTYSDGHKEYEDDNSQHWIAWILGLCLLVAIALFMALWAIINYLRNYVFYF